MRSPYLKVQDDILRRIVSGELNPGDKLPSENDLSSEYQVSRMTLRKALAILCSEGYIYQVRGLGTFVTSPDDKTTKILRERSQYNRKKTKGIGMLISCVTGSLYPPIIRGVEDILYKHGYHLVLGNYDAVPAKEQKYMETFVRNGFSGLLIAASYNSHLNPYYVTLKNRHIPFVLIDTDVKGLDADLVTADSRKGSRAVTKLLISSGCRRIAIVCGSLESFTSKERLAGYREALEEAGIPVREELIYTGEFKEEFGYQATCSLLASHKPDGILSANEPITPGVLNAIHEKGLAIPDDIRIVSFDEPELPGWLQTPIPLMVQPGYEIGKAAAELLLQRIGELRNKETSSDKRILIEPKLLTGRRREGNAIHSNLEVCNV